MERNIHHHKDIGKSLNTNTDRTMAKVAYACFFSGVIINVDDLVQIIHDKGSDALEFGKIKQGVSAPQRRNYVRMVAREVMLPYVRLVAREVMLPYVRLVAREVMLPYVRLVVREVMLPYVRLGYDS